MKNKNIYWAIYLIVAAVVFLVNALDLFPTTVSVWSLITSTVLGAITIDSVTRLNFYGVCIPLAVIGIIYADELKINAITPVPLLIAAILISIALQIIFKKKI